MMLAIFALLVFTGAVSQGNVMYIDDFEIYPDSTVTVSLMMANSDSTRGCQLNLTLPDGLTLVKKELTSYAADDYRMNIFSSRDGNVWTLGMYPSERLCFPPADTAIMNLTFAAVSEFRGGQILLWKQRGANIDNKTIYFDNDTAIVTVPTSSLIGIPVDKQQNDERYFNLMGQPISAPDSVPVAICVTTRPDGSVDSRKVAMRP